MNVSSTSFWLLHSSFRRLFSKRNIVISLVSSIILFKTSSIVILFY
nr:MAG TPA: hypothetical protein [Caudoviricetes sp.]